MLGVVFLIVLRGARWYGRVGVGLFGRCGWWLSVWKWRGYGDWDRQLVAFVGWLSMRERYINGSERGDSFRDVVAHVRRVGGCAARRPATVR
eukprot:4401379-Pleurochrysis_carterae.AAC.1